MSDGILKFKSKDGRQEATMEPGDDDPTQVTQYQLGEILIERAQLAECKSVLEDCERRVMLKLHQGLPIQRGMHIAILYQRPVAARIDWQEVVERRLGKEVVQEEIEAAHKIAALQQGSYMAHYGLVVE